MTDSGEKLICPECDYKLDQILKHWDDGVVLPPKVSPPIPGGGTPTQLEKSEVCSYCNGCGYVEDPCNHLAFFKLCPICKNSSILTVKDVKE